MQKSKKVALSVIGLSVISPLLFCVGLLLFGISDVALIFAAVYVVFGLPLVLIIGWLLSFAAKRSKRPVTWTAVCFSVPALWITIVMASITLSGA